MDLFVKYYPRYNLYNKLVENLVKIFFFIIFFFCTYLFITLARSEICDYRGDH